MAYNCTLSHPSNLSLCFYRKSVACHAVAMSCMRRRARCATQAATSAFGLVHLLEHVFLTKSTVVLRFFSGGGAEEQASLT